MKHLKFILISFAVSCMISTVMAAPTEIPDDTDYLWVAPEGNWQEKAEGTYSDGPYWLQGSDYGKLYVHNFPLPDYTKTVWLELTFKDENARGLAMNLPIFQEATVPAGSSSSTAWPYIGTDPLVVTWAWTIKPQPSWEILDLTNSIWDLQNLGGDNPVQKIRVASKCVVPAPGAIVLAGIGTGFVGWLRRRRAI